MTYLITTQALALLLLKVIFKGHSASEIQHDVKFVFFFVRMILLTWPLQVFQTSISRGCIRQMCFLQTGFLVVQYKITVRPSHT